MKKIKLDPKCLKDATQLPITNEGQLIPCCYLDSGHTRGNPLYEKLLQASKISDYETIDEILNTLEWKEFEENLKIDIGPPACVNTCRVRDSEDIIRKEFLIHPKTGKVEKHNI